MYIDLDWEFDAPHWCDLENEECLVNDNWFEEEEKKALNTKNQELNEPKAENIETVNKEQHNAEEPNKKSMKFDKNQSRIPIFSKKLAKSSNHAMTKSTTNLLKPETQENSSRIKLKSNIPILRNSQSRLIL